MRAKLRLFLRRLLRRCLACGGTLRPPHPRDLKGCPYCTVVKGWCHWCGKRWNFGRFYGVSKQTLKTMLLPDVVLPDMPLRESNVSPAKAIKLLREEARKRK